MKSLQVKLNFCAHLVKSPTTNKCQHVGELAEQDSVICSLAAELFIGLHLERDVVPTYTCNMKHCPTDGA